MTENNQERVSLPELADRQRDILRAVIREFISTAQPVASGALVRRYALPVSSATVRNELAELEDLGLLTHPHTSAGRVPTDLGYRYFIESLMPDTALRPEEQLTVSHQFQQAQRDTAQWLRLAASTLARLTAEASIVTQPAGTKSALKHVEAVPIHDRRVLIVAVLEGGAVRQQLLDLDQPATADELRALGQRLTDTRHGADAATLADAAMSERGVAQQIVRALAGMLAETEAARASDVYYDGIQNILAQPEFGPGDPARLREMVALLEAGPDSLSSCRRSSARARCTSPSAPRTASSRCSIAASCSAATAARTASSGTSGSSGRDAWTTPGRSARSASSAGS